MLRRKTTLAISIGGILLAQAALAGAAEPADTATAEAVATPAPEASAPPAPEASAPPAPEASAPPAPEASAPPAPEAAAPPAPEASAPPAPEAAAPPAPEASAPPAPEAAAPPAPEASAPPAPEAAAPPASEAAAPPASEAAAPPVPDAGAPPAPPMAMPARLAPAPHRAPGNILMTPAEQTAYRNTMRGMSEEERDAFRDEQYAALRQRARELGMALPETPPWKDPSRKRKPTMTEGEYRDYVKTLKSLPPGERHAYQRAQHEKIEKRMEELTPQLPGMPPPPAMPEPPPPPPALGAAPGDDWTALHRRLQTMTPEQRRRYREAHYQRLREVAKAAGIELPETPPWDMTAEQRAAQIQEQRDAFSESLSRMPWPGYTEPEQWGMPYGPERGAWPAAPGYGYPQERYFGWGPYDSGPWSPYPYD